MNVTSHHTFCVSSWIYTNQTKRRRTYQLCPIFIPPYSTNSMHLWLVLFIPYELAPVRFNTGITICLPPNSLSKVELAWLLVLFSFSMLIFFKEENAKEGKIILSQYLFIGNVKFVLFVFAAALTVLLSPVATFNLLYSQPWTSRYFFK